MLQQEPIPQTEDIMERTRHLNSLKLMAEENRTPERSPDSPLTEEHPNTEVAPSAAPVGEPSEKGRLFFCSCGTTDTPFYRCRSPAQL